MITRILILTSEVDAAKALMPDIEYGLSIARGKKSGLSLFCYESDNAFNASSLTTPDYSFLDKPHIPKAIRKRTAKVIEVMSRGKKFQKHIVETIMEEQDPIESPPISDVKNLTEEEAEALLAWSGF